MMNNLGLLIRKEWLLLARDKHGLALLFIMPCIFILIMSFALDSTFRSVQTAVQYQLIDLDKSAATAHLREQLLEQFGPATDSPTGSGGKAQFVLQVEPDFETKLVQAEQALVLTIDANASAGNVALFEAFLYQHLSERAVQITLELEEMELDLDVRSVIEKVSNYKGPDNTKPRPTAVQQNVPAWLLFAMFFITIPLSNTLISERQQGTYQRLRNCGVSTAAIYLSKVIPYFMLNMIQAVAMLAIGLWLIPALGGEQLHINGSYFALVGVAASASLVAISFALLVATLANTSEQATISTGVSNIIMAALGGVMVPVFLMPEAMQTLSKLSPMAWGLQGFLDVLLYSGTMADVLPEMAVLSAIALLLALLLIPLTKRPNGH